MTYYMPTVYKNYVFSVNFHPFIMILGAFES
jgi:hypothetical protein